MAISITIPLLYFSFVPFLISNPLGWEDSSKREGEKNSIELPPLFQKKKAKKPNDQLASPRSPMKNIKETPQTCFSCPYHLLFFLPPAAAFSPLLSPLLLLDEDDPPPVVVDD